MLEHDADAPPRSSIPRAFGRYEVIRKLATGGMASLYLGRFIGEVGFTRMVVLKRPHPHLAEDPRFELMFIDEARLAGHIRHANVVPTVDVFLENGLVLVMEYVEGASLADLAARGRARGEKMPIEIASSIVSGALQGLHAVHTATNENGEALGIIHRDVSPQNVQVGIDGVARVLDFGVAKANVRMYLSSGEGTKGKLAYMAPEQIVGMEVGRATDVFSAAVVLWELATSRRLFDGATEAEAVHNVMERIVDAPSAFERSLSPAFDAVVMRGLDRDPHQRFATADAMARALEAAVPPATAARVAEWVRGSAKLEERPVVEARSRSPFSHARWMSE